MLNKQQLIRNISNIPGWYTKRKIVVFESDDWGSIRMPSVAVFKRMQLKGINLTEGESERYNKNDSLASTDDLAALFEILSSKNDKNSVNPVFTAASVVANPAFDKIKDSDFREYFYEPFTETLKRIPACDNSFHLWQEGIQKKLFIPQFHGREHLNVAVWMRALQKKEKNTVIAFNEGTWGFSNVHPLGISYQAAFELEHFSDLENQRLILTSGLKLFEEIFGYKATFFVPPNGPFNNMLEVDAAKSGIEYMSGSKLQHESLGEGKTRKTIHWLGQKNKVGQLYITRNCFFEPSSNVKTDWVNSCLNEINIAFRWHKPAVISTHRVNYIGGLNPHNRAKGLNQLKQLLNAILIKWPDVEFFTSNQLGDLMSRKG